MDAEGRWRAADELLHLVWVHPDATGGAIHLRAGPREDIQGPIAKHLDADLGQDPERRQMDRLELVRGQDLERTERVDQAPPRETRHAAAGPAVLAARGAGG